MNGTTPVVSFADRPTVVARFEDRVRRHPDAPALISGAERLSYAELNARANRVAAGLRARGVRAESRVGLCLERTADLPVTLLGIAKSGAAYVALDPQHPRERLALLADSSGAACVVTEPDATADWPVPAVTVKELSGAPGALDTDPPLAAGPGNALYAVFTSGSTGRPKAVVMEHGPTARLMEWTSRRYRLDGVVLQYFPVTSDVCGYELLSAWWSGGCVVLAEETDRFDVTALAELIRRHQVDTVLLPGAVLEELARHARRHPASVASVRQIVTTGDRLTVGEHLRAMCADLGDGLVLDNQWGSTEVNVVTALRLQAPPDDWPTTPSIGSPVSGGKIHVLDERLRRVPVNVPGDLYVGGGQLARGYLGRPDLTAAAFLPDPFTDTPGGRMYRTGDRGRWRPDGTLEFLGRADFQLKIHGYRVEPGEIEGVLRDHPAVARAAVTARTTDAGARLTAYAAPPAGEELPTADALLDFLRARLPHHMVPHACVVLERLPSTATGKVDRKALPEPRDERHEPAPPRDETDRRIIAMWEEVLGRTGIRLHDNFFDLGGHSLLIPQVVLRVNRAFGVSLSLRTLFRSQTARALADEVRAAREATTTTAATAAPATAPQATPSATPTAQEAPDGRR
ncbi:non-ribosomal peptide synthetase [Streptomyces sp. G45]|uniref:non-ribosomal peptide synthetase n=1 Tax=Streptomyces sp. G45 TaxID=3406627 RepID=UPI003C26F42D